MEDPDIIEDDRCEHGSWDKDKCEECNELCPCSHTYRQHYSKTKTKIPCDHCNCENFGDKLGPDSFGGSDYYG